jgi:hypothetical protein
MVTPKLNEPLEISGTVPSDNPEVNILHTDGFPFLAEGVRQLYGFRRESDTSPYYTIRASTLIMQVSDASASGDARSRFTSWDPWQYLFSLPVLQSSLATIGNGGSAGVDGLLIPAANSFYPQSVSADQIIVDILTNATAFSDPTAPVAAQNCFLDLTGGTIEVCSAPAIGKSWEIQQGTSIGQALQDICATGACDIVLTPIYDPSVRPGILCELNVRTQTSPANGAGSFNYSAVFAWDKPGRSVVGIDDVFDGTQRANHIVYYNGQGGPPIAPYASAQFRDPVSIATYGEYAPSQFFPAQTVKEGVQAIAAQQLVLRANFKQTLTINPAPERSPEPFVDYYLGDRVPVYASNNMRQVIPPVPTTNANINLVNSASIVVHSTAGFPVTGTIVLLGGNVTYTGTTATAFTGCSGHPATLGGEGVIGYGILAWQRIYGIPVQIDDNGVETVREILVGPVGGPPPVSGPAAPMGFKSMTTNQRNSRNTKRIGSVQVKRNGQFTV